MSELNFVRFRGGLAAVGNIIDKLAQKWSIGKCEIPEIAQKNQKKRDGNNYHLTVVPSKEYKSVNDKSVKVNISPEDIYDLGIGKAKWEICFPIGFGKSFSSHKYLYHSSVDGRWSTNHGICETIGRSSPYTVSIL